MSLDAGVPTSQEALVAYKMFKMEKKYEFVVFKTNDKLSSIVVDVCPTQGESEQAWKEVGSTCKVARAQDEPVHFWNLRRILVESGEPRYATILITHGLRTSLLMIFWSPDYIPSSKKKMVYSSTKISFKNKLEGIQSILQCNDLEELSYSEIFKAST